MKLLAMIQRYLNDNNSSTNIMKDQEFAKSTEVHSARKGDLVVTNAKGNRPQAAREQTEDEEDLLFETGQIQLPNFFTVANSHYQLR